MPNWTTNHVEITGSKENIATLISDTKLGFEVGDTEFDFKGIVPMPDALNIESGSSTDLGLAAHDDEAFRYTSSFPWFRDRYPDAKTREEFASTLEDKQPEVYNIGKVAFKNKQEYGYATWYEWKNARWGTKWGASHAVLTVAPSDTRVVLSFDTPWVAPVPIFDALEERGLSVRAVSVHEGGEEPTSYGDAWEVFSTWTEVQYVG
ncbi:hypothetical protein QFZ70_001479 [Arthrobacter sp. V1I9]|uniref:hypothetical protein n=1 Tax=Arthrobacter sp. V1I9 TaxID=3042275 RepID=UPI00278DCC4B|nr:hypothetical protein [Arthrobacter sp. V1I9]MDQ0869006.1 hypothetical protein [Arthrobacter sp. V1I9]